MLTALVIWTIFPVQRADANQRLNIVTSTTDLAWVVSQIGGEHAEVNSLLSGREDPHFVDVRPDYVSRLMKADIVCVVGLDLELGWMPKVLKKTGRKQIQPGGTGHCELGKKVEPLNKPQGRVDRSMGDVHPNGNPHFWLSPKTFAHSAQEVLLIMNTLRPEHREIFQANYEALKRTMGSLEEDLKKKLEKAGVTKEKARFVQYHSEFNYLAQSLGLQSAAEIEDKPGIKPSAPHLVKVADLVRKENIRIVLASTHASKAVARKFEELSGVKVQIVPVSMTAFTDKDAYRNLLTGIVEQIIDSSNTSVKNTK